MKYLTHTTCFKEVAPHVDEVEVGWDRLSHTPDWPEYAAFRLNAIETGGLDRYWGPMDRVGEVDGLLKKVTICYNTEEAALGWYNLIIDADGYPISPTTIMCRVVEVADDGTVQRIVKASIPIIPEQP